MIIIKKDKHKQSLKIAILYNNFGYMSQIIVIILNFDFFLKILLT